MMRITEDQKQVTDEMLMVRYQRGSRDAFAALVSRYSSTIFSVGYYLLGSETQADKLAQETFLQVVREAATYNLEAQFRTWIFGLLHKVAGEHYSDHAVSGEEGRSLSSDPVESSTPESPPPSSRAYRSQILARRVASRVSSLPFPMREAFLFKQAGQLTMNDIATAVGADIDTVRQLIRAAFDRIQGCVADTEEYARALR
jgi:RNA polymerase sigma-70 factor, ECF subfamily